MDEQVELARLIQSVEPTISLLMQQMNIRVDNRDDVAQQCRIRLIRCYPDYNPKLASWSHFARLNIRYEILEYMRLGTGVRRKYNLRFQNQQSAIDELTYADPPSERMEQEEDFEVLISRLPARDRAILRMYFLKLMNMKLIAQSVKLSEGRVSQIIKTSLKKLATDSRGGCRTERP